MPVTDKKHGKKNSFDGNLGNWLAGFWILIGGFFRKRLDVIRGEYTFEELGCQSHEISIMTEDCTPQKVWLLAEQSKTSDPEVECNMVSSYRRDNGIVLHANIESAPCTVKLFIIC